MGEMKRVVVPFWVNGMVGVERTYWVEERWRELCRAVAKDIDRAPALELRPFVVEFLEREVQLCVDTGSPNGSVAIHYADPDQWDREDMGNVWAMLERPIRVQRCGWASLAEPYGFKRIECPV